MRRVLFTLVLLLVGCNSGANLPPSPEALSQAKRTTLAEARRGFVTKVVTNGEPFGPPDVPTGLDFSLISYESSAGPLAAYVTPDPGDGQRHPAILWITGGDSNSIGDVWSPQDRSNDQTASAFRRVGIAMMFPLSAGGNDNPGRREGFFGEVDDVLAATEYLASLPYVDRDQIYLGGHSTGGTLVMLVAECSDRYRGVFSLGPVADPAQYGGEFVYCDPNNETEMQLRSPSCGCTVSRVPCLCLRGPRMGTGTEPLS